MYHYFEVVKILLFLFTLENEFFFFFKCQTLKNVFHNSYKNATKKTKGTFSKFSVRKHFTLKQTHP